MSGKDSAADKKLGMAVVEAQAEMMSQMQQKLADTMIRVCFKRCVTAPDASLNDRQRRCLDSCTKSFQEGFGIASDTLGQLVKSPAAE